MTRWIDTPMVGPLITGILALIGLFSWLIRKLFTNEKQIAIMQAEMKHMNDSLNKLTEIQSQVHPIVDKQTLLLERLVTRVESRENL